MSRKAQSTPGEWTAKLASHGWYVEFDAMNGACIDNELTAKGIANAHNCAISAERESLKDAQEEAFAAYAEVDAIREQLAAEREKVDNATENCMSLSKLLYETREQLAKIRAK